MPAVKNSLKAAGIPRDKVRLWVADYDGITTIPHGYDAKQFTDVALGRNLDESICVDTFFDPLGRTTPVAQDLHRATVSFDVDTKKWEIGPAPFERDVN